ncbi:ATP-binding protein [bacterium]|nr:ATP-binding protein [bacterium]
MKLQRVILNNLRGYKKETEIDIDDLTAFIGKNDVGKSTILEALEIFFNNDGKVKFDKSDVCVYGKEKEVRIGCVFTDFPELLVLDVKAQTSLKEEYLLNRDGDLEIHKCFDCSGQKIKEKIIAIALHPTIENADDLLLLKNEDLKQRFETLKIPKKETKLNVNPSIRKAIWTNFPDLKLEEKEILLNSESDKKMAEGDSKKIWKKLSDEMPVFALFQADRASNDDDDEVQDPMKTAVKEAMKLVQPQMDQIKTIVQSRALEVANRTLEKLNEMNPELARKLIPDFKAEPKWDSLFKLTLKDQDQIPINKRGSGVRRLILINFFRAEAERRQKEQNAPAIIYAIEEPETSQHPQNQKMLAEAFKELSDQSNCQVLVTTHVPGFAGLLNVESLRHVLIKNDEISIKSGEEDIYEEITRDLGVLPELNEVKILICVEGPNDVSFLCHISTMLHNHDPSLPDIKNDPRIAIFPLGGSTLRQWVNRHYLKGLHKKEIHIYDNQPEYLGCCIEVNARNDGSWATVTGKKTIENYLHPDIINNVYNINVNFGDDDDVPHLVAQRFHESQNSSQTWDTLGKSNKSKKISQCKKRLNDEIVSQMTYELLSERDVSKDIENWLREIANRLQ